MNCVKTSSQSLPSWYQLWTPGQAEPVRSFREKADHFEDFISQGTKDNGLCQAVIRCLMLFVVGAGGSYSVDLLKIKFRIFNLRKDLRL